MKKPSAYDGASVLVLVLLLMKTSAAGNQHEQACIPPGSNGQYSVVYNNARLPILKPSAMQDYVLREVSTEFTNEFRQGRRLEEFCTYSGRNAYSAVAGDNYIDLFGYAYCDQGLNRQGCTACLQGGAQAIKQSCGNSCYGAQASSDYCCIRFEAVQFCQITTGG
ncbi:hypothetical protein LINGRAHAP2_LOCUS12161 [Linum grandiflorum]